MILKEVKPGKYVESRKAFRGVKVARLRADAERVVNNMYIDFADDAQFVEDIRNSFGDTSSKIVLRSDLGHAGVVKFEMLRIGVALTRVMFLNKIDDINSRLI